MKYQSYPKSWKSQHIGTKDMHKSQPYRLLTSSALPCVALEFLASPVEKQFREMNSSQTASAFLPLTHRVVRAGRE